MCTSFTLLMSKLFPPTENYFSCVEDTDIKLSR